MSAIADPVERSGPIQVLIALHDGFDSLDYVGPMEALHWAKHDDKSISTSSLSPYPHPPPPLHH